MKKTLLAIGLAVATMPLTFAGQAPAAPNASGTQSTATTKKPKKVKKPKKSTTAPANTAAPQK